VISVLHVNLIDFYKKNSVFDLVCAPRFSFVLSLDPVVVFFLHSAA
jgi:hypothetical protein